MTRPPPRYRPGQIVARCVLDPNGAHQLEVAITGGLMIAVYDAATLPDLEAAIEQFRALTSRADGGPDFYNRRVVPIEVGK